MSRVLRGQLRRSSALIATPLALGVIAWSLWSNFDHWRWEWDWGMLNPGSAWPVLGPLLAACTSLDAVRARTLLGEVTLEGPEVRRSVWPAFMIPTVAIVLVWALSLPVAASLLAGSNAVGGIQWWGLLGQGFGLVAFGAIGTVIGTRIPRWWIPPLVGLLAYFVPYFSMFFLNLQIPLPRLVGWYVLNTQDNPFTAVTLTLISAGLILVLAPINSERWIQRLGATLALIPALVHIVIAPTFSPSLDEPSVIGECTTSSAIEVCTIAEFSAFLDHIAAVAGSVLANAAVPLPRLVVVDFSSAVALAPADGLPVGAHAGMVRPEWIPDPRFLPNDLGQQVLESVLSNFCGPLGAEWEKDVAAEILFVSSLPGWPTTFDDTYASTFSSAGPPSAEQIQALWVDASEGCDSDRLMRRLVEMGISQ